MYRTSGDALRGLPNRLAVFVVLGVAIIAIRGAAEAPALTPPGPLASPPAECTRFASEHGSDAQRGTWRRPVRTVGRLIETLRRGETGCLRAGTYPGSRPLSVRKGGISLRSYPGERALIRQNLEVVNGANGVQLSRLAIEGTGSQNTIQVLAADFVLEDSDITNAWRGQSCIILGVDGFGTAVRPVIRRNKFHECGLKDDFYTHGIYAGHLVDGKITDNVIWNMGGFAIQLYPNAQRTVFAHNVIDGTDASAGGVIFGGGDGNFASRNNIVEFNVIAYATRFNISSTWESTVGTGNIARSNCVFGGGAGDIGSTAGLTAQNNLIADPAFVSRANHNYRLASGSPCLNVVGYDTAARLSPGAGAGRR